MRIGPIEIRRFTEAVEIDGVVLRLPPAAAQVVKRALEARVAELARVTSDAAAAIEAFRGREVEALAQADAAAAKVATIEAELAAERAGRAADVAALRAELAAIEGERDGQAGVLLRMPTRGQA